MKKPSRKIKVIAISLLATFLFEIFIPTVAFALTSGPSSPEFSSFEPVATTNMVDPFTGGFTYNIPILNVPGPDGGDYALSLSYHSGASCEEESSWVGYGWSLNPGALNRNVQGIPDEYNGEQIKYYNKMKPNWTLTASDLYNFESFSYSVGLSASKALRFNNYQGFASSYSFGLDFKGWTNIGINVDAAGVTFNASVNFSKLLLSRTNKSKALRRSSNDIAKVSPASKSKLFSLKKELNKTFNSLTTASAYGICSAMDPVMPTNVANTRGYILDFSASIGGRPAPAPIGVEYGSKGSFSIQWNKNDLEELSAYGYNYNNISSDGPLNSSSISEDNNKITDFIIERNQMFDKQDLYLGIPFACPDNYIVATEGLGGSFRPYSLSTNFFFPQEKKSKSFQVGTGVELALGTNLGIGFNLGLGYSSTNVSRCNKPVLNNEGNPADYHSDIYQQQSNVFYKFYGDKGANISFGNNKTPYDILYKQPNFPGVAKGYLNVEPNDYKNNNLVECKKSSSYIQKNTLGGFTIYNESGSCYTFNQTIKSRNEANITINANEFNGNNNAIVDIYKTTAFKQMELHLIGGGDEYEYEMIENNDHSCVIGDIKNQPYTSTYLLTGITTSDYIDLGLPGPDKDDFGGWTKFSYHQVELGENNWYRWRNPFIGLSYSINELSDKLDDMASVSTGEREIKYLDKIETKTHLAEFVTSDRLDAFGAALPGEENDPSANSQTSSGCRRFPLKKLDKILLYAKGPDYINNPDDKQLLKIVYFEYDYSVVGNSPNNLYSFYPGNSQELNTGKLTLKKVWTEYIGVVNTKISPYEFSYAYKNKTEYTEQLTELFPSLDGMQDFFNLSDIYKDVEQNPNYAPYILDAWGNIQYNSKERRKNMQYFLYQGEYIDQVEFDPAAWQLKQIRLPSGGEILIEYEQNDYAYVQDRKAMALVSLINTAGNSSATVEKDYGASEYVINLSDLGISSGNFRNSKYSSFNEYMQYYVDDLNNYFKNEKIYYKFLYALKGNQPGINDPYSEYIEGYTTIKQPDGIVWDEVNSRLIFQLDRENFGTGNIYGPRQAAYDFYSNNRIGMFPSDAHGKQYLNYMDDVAQILAGKDDKLTILDAVNLLANPLLAMANLKTNLYNQQLAPLPKSMIAKYYNCNLSYLKLPLPEDKSKKGGGIRVKRLLMYDAGIEYGDASICGNEYVYKTNEVINRENELPYTIELSSGVATNEPNAIRNENPLVTFLPKKSQSWVSRHIIGVNRESSEGPIGETILPAPSVGYSKVKVKNIHSGKTGTGYTIYDYYTAKDYPFDKSYNFTAQFPDNRFEDPGAPVQNTDLPSNTKGDFMNIPAGLLNYKSQKIWASQGYKFVITDFHGLLKNESSYDENNNLVYAMSKEYFNPTEKVRMMKGDKTWSWVNPGKEMDIAIEDKSVKTFSIDLQLELDISVGLMTPPPFYPTGLPYISWDDKLLNTHVSSKIIHYPVIEKSTTIYKDGIKSKTENLAFDYATGTPVLTRTWDAYDKIPVASEPDGHDGSIYSFNIPAHWMYNAMGRKSDNITNMNDLKSSAGFIQTYGMHGDTTYNLHASSIGSSVFQWNYPQYELNSSPACYVLSASVTTYEKGSNITSWLDNDILTYHNVPQKVQGDLIAAFNEIYRPYQSYVYKTDVKNKLADNCKIYEEGLFKKFIPFDFTPGSTNNGKEWLKTSEITKYSPDGAPLEEKDILGTYSSVLFGSSYKFALPVMIAQNAKRNEIWFFDFEQGSSDIAHSGYTAALLNDFSISIPLTSNMTSKGVTMLFWASNPNLDNYSVTANQTVFPLKKIAQTGEWSLFKADLAFSPFSAVGVISINSGISNVFIDDLRLQPADAKAICYVYNKYTLKLITQFDDQNFGLYYQYNAEGQLVRKMVETENGMKTLQETQYNVKKSASRPPVN